MNRQEWKFRQWTGLLLAVVLLDGALLGTMAGVVNRSASLPEHQVLQVDQLERISSKSDSKVVALTFDDGPQDGCTDRLLDGLKERGVHASFFIMGENISGNEELVKRMSQEGHLLGNHSYRHVRLTEESEAIVCGEIEKNGDIIEGITGIRPQYLRPPYGAWNDDLECRLEMTTVFWSVDSLDWKLQNKARVVKQVMKQVENGDIILMHDIFPESVDAALEIVDRLLAEGYTFVTVDEMMVD